MDINQMFKATTKSKFSNIKSKFSIFGINSSFLVILTIFIAAPLSAQLRDIQLDEVRWKDEAHVRSLLGDPNSVHGPSGTHASYVLWKYDNLTVAFSNGRVFHIFAPDSLKKMALEGKPLAPTPRPYVNKNNLILEALSTASILQSTSL